MLDFVSVKKCETKYGVKVYPEFLVINSTDLMIRGQQFYAIWDEDSKFWLTKEQEVQRLVDKMVLEEANNIVGSKQVELMRDYSNGTWEKWRRYCKSLSDNYHDLDQNVLYLDSEREKTLYASKCLPYNLDLDIDMPTPNYDRIMRTLYDENERTKLEWAIGSIIAGDSKKLQKFIVLYGDSGTGKSTFLKILEGMFQGYYSYFNAKSLGSNSDQFALESLKDNSLIAINHDADLSRIEDNTNLNSIVSHEELVVNEKHKSKYTTTFHSMLFIGTNKPVKITDAKSGIIRRMIDVYPSNRLLPVDDYMEVMERMPFEYPGIAKHCLNVYQTLGKKYYISYVPVTMIGETNDMYCFIEDNYDLFLHESEDGIALSEMWRRYKTYCEDANVSYPLSMKLFKIEMKTYFEEFYERYKNRYSVYFGFKRKKFEIPGKEETTPEEEKQESWLVFHDAEGISVLDHDLSDCKAQYSSSYGTPKVAWDSCETLLKDLDPKKEHYVLPPGVLVVADFDLKNKNGEKDFQLNLEAASKFPPTYAELSKSGNGIHLHYYYTGDTSMLDSVFDKNKDIEIKVFSGKAALRRRLSKCNSLPIATISSGLPLKEEKKRVITDKTIKTEKGLRSMIIRNLKKEFFQHTKPSIDFIDKILQDAYADGVKYDVTDLRPDVQDFALRSSHNAQYCLKKVSKMPFKSDDQESDTSFNEKDPIIFFDIEVFPNLLLVVYKEIGEGKPKKILINPKPHEVAALFKLKLVGYNVRRYDNHILYAASMGYTTEQLAKLSQRIINDHDKDAFFGPAYNISYTDIYDFSSDKKSLKKWEVELGISHQEMDLDWTEPIPDHLIPKLIEYCGNDVDAEEAVWNVPSIQADFKARLILARMAHGTPNDTTNSLTTKLIVGLEKNPQASYPDIDLTKYYEGYEYNPYGIDPIRYDDPDKISTGKSIYKGKDPSEGGYALGNPGAYYWVAVLDVESMHPTSIEVLNYFGEHTVGFARLKELRLSVKHGDIERGKKAIAPDLYWIFEDDISLDDLAFALKIAINAVYGLTSASFDNKLRNPRNVGNPVAKYGALFMIDLEEEVQRLGYRVVHIKTDSIKIANADKFIIKHVQDFAKKYGFNMEHEATYERICIVNDSVFIAKYASKEFCANQYDGFIPKKNQKHPLEWTATGAQFQIPYVFKTLFSKEDLELDDLTKIQSVQSAMYLDFNEGLPDVEKEEKLLELRNSIEKDPDTKVTKTLQKMLDENASLSNENLEETIAKGHHYYFIGKVGKFYPVLDGKGGGILVRVDKSTGKYYAVPGTKKEEGGVYRWKEADSVLADDVVEQLDYSYFEKLDADAKAEISKYVDFDYFVSNQCPAFPDFMNIPGILQEEEIPFK